MSFKGNTFNDRIAEQKKAKLEMLKRAKEKARSPEELEKITAERIERAARREERQKEAEAKRNFRKLQEAALKAEKQMKNKKSQSEIAAEQKAKRDARYAARKAKR